jgi:hypothetical protein
MLTVMCTALFLNLAIQAKKQIHKDAAAKARGKIVGMPRNEGSRYYQTRYVLSRLCKEENRGDSGELYNMK